uniref:Ribonucleases P/MRP protein subunit POP1 n=1 Tax=Acrobeloides nanus TaxID=290746 RepID=A0A914CCF8_9BILA
MRRRAMSHNIKRLPRVVQAFAAKMMIKSKHRKKAPSRFWRRRPFNLLKNYIRRQQKQIWLETHIWHAKRFRMTPTWGYKIPWTSYQRSFRPNYRDSKQKVVIMDQSYLHCFQQLSCLCRPETSVTFAFKPARSSLLETPILLFDRESQLLAPCRFSWHSAKDGSSSLCLWVHPIVSANLLSTIVNLLNLQKKEEVDVDKNKPFWKSYSSYKLHSMKILTEIFENDKFRLLNLRDQLVRFSLVGPNALTALNSIAKLVEEDEFPEDCRSDQFVESHKFWKGCSNHQRPDQFRDGTIISLLVEDPRIYRAQKHSSDNMANIEHQSLLRSDPPKPADIFWNRTFRIDQLAKRLSTSELDRMRANNLSTLKSTPFKIPLLIVVRNISRKGSTSTLSSGVDLILPAGTGVDFWVALHMAGARAIGLRDRMALMFESDRLNFPADIPDSKAGKQYIVQEKKSLEEKHRKRPHNRQVRYELIRVKFPFSFAWSALIADWTRNTISEDQVYVLRDRIGLLKIDSWLRGKTSRPDSIIQEHRKALIPIKLQAIKSGCPKRHGLICIPTSNDMSRFKNDPKTILTEEIEQMIPNDNESSDEETNIARPKLPLPEFISLDITKKEKLVSLNEMFPDKEMLKENRKRNKKNSKRKETKKKPKKEPVILANEKEESPTNYKDSCSRTIIGRIVRGDFSFSMARGSALGYCVLESLLSLDSRMVLFRNSTSKYYHPANLSVLINSIDL